MTKTAWELWFDDAFLVKRLKEQETYLRLLQHRLWMNEIDQLRYDQLFDSASFVKSRIEHQLSRPHPITKTY